MDLRLQREKTYPYEFVLGKPLQAESNCEFRTLPEKSDAEVDFSGIAVPHHLTKELLSHFPKAKAKDSMMLDLGCGDMVHRDVCEAAGFEHVGLDYGEDMAQLHGDAHALPFQDDSFEFVLSIAVLEHIQFPFVVMNEVHRVLKPGGLFIGTVSFLEPFHQDSFYHHTHLGTYNSLNEGKFEIAYVCPSKQWHGLAALSSMSLFPKLPVFLSRAIVAPVQALHRLWWMAGRFVTSKATEDARIRETTGAFTFIARKR